MGKRLPKSKRHKKLKFVDPAYTGPGPKTKRNRKILYNEPPKFENEQEISNNMKEFMNIKSDAETNKFKRRRKKKKKKKIQKDDFITVTRDPIETNQFGMTRPIKPVENVIKQRKNESQFGFFARIQKMVNFSIAEAEVETKYDIDLVHVDKSGVAKYLSAPKEATQNRKEKRKKHKEKVNDKKRKKIDNNRQFDLKPEQVQFGDVVAAPPQFTSKPRKALQLDKAGKRNLMLKQLVNPNKNSAKEQSVISGPKWKQLTPDRRKVVELESSRAVQMYRLLKKNKASLV